LNFSRRAVRVSHEATVNHVQTPAYSQSPDHYSSINAARGDVRDVSCLPFVLPQGVDRVLMNRLQLAVISDLALQVHLPKHVERRLFPVLVAK